MNAPLDQTFFRPVRPGNAFEDTVQRLLQTIRLGVVGAGERLPSERELALSMAVSRDTVRDAIKALADAGYVVTRRGRYGGTFVVENLPRGAAPIGRSGGDDGSVHPLPTPDELEDILACREILEIGAVRVAAGRTMTAARREWLWAQLQAVSGAEPDDYRRFDSRFHLALAELAGAPTLLPVLADNRMQVNRYLDDIPLLERNIRHSDQQHEAIVIAVLAGDSDAAARTMEEHLAGSAALLRGFLA